MCVIIKSWVPIDAKTHLGHHHHKHVLEHIDNKHGEIKHDKRTSSNPTCRNPIDIHI